MSHLTLRALGAAVLGMALAACSTDQVTDAAPRAANLDVSATAASSLVINEIMANPSAVLDDFGEWFEIYNPGSTPVDLQNYRIVSNNDAAHVIGQSVVIPAGGYVVLARNGDSTANGGVNENYTYPGTFTLANGNTDWLALRDPSGASVDSVHWGTSSVPTAASRGVVDPAIENTLMSGAGANWSTQTSPYNPVDKGTPGRLNDGGTAPPPPPPPPPPRAAPATW